MNPVFSLPIPSRLSRIFFGAVAASFLAFLPATGWAHGEVAGGGQQSATRMVEAPGGKYRIVVTNSPALPTAEEPANIELTIMRLLPEPDPLLGSEFPVSLLPEASLVYAGSQKVADPNLHVHPEGEAGVFGIAAYKFPASGSFLLRFRIQSETGDQFSVDFPVTVQVNVASFFRLWVNLAVAVLILGLMGMQLWKVRVRGGELAEMLRPISRGVISLLAVILLMNFFVLDQVLAMRKPKAAEWVTINEDGSYTIPEAIQKKLGIALAAVKQVPLEQSISAAARSSRNRSAAWGVAVPEQAVVDDGATKRVYVARDKERFEPLPVEIGVKQDRWWQVVSGLQEGDLVIADVLFRVENPGESQ